MMVVCDAMRSRLKVGDDQWTDDLAREGGIERKGFCDEERLMRIGRDEVEVVVFLDGDRVLLERFHKSVHLFFEPLFSIEQEFSSHSSVLVRVNRHHDQNLR